MILKVLKEWVVACGTGVLIFGPSLTKGGQSRWDHEITGDNITLWSVIFINCFSFTLIPDTCLFYHILTAHSPLLF